MPYMGLDEAMGMFLVTILFKCLNQSLGDGGSSSDLFQRLTQACSKHLFTFFEVQVAFILVLL